MPITSNITLVMVDAVNKDAAIVLNGVKDYLGITDVFFVSSNIPTIASYNKFIVHELHKYVNTDYALIIQADGYPVNKAAWTDEFLKYDYIGAPWYLQPWELDKTVGNGGFSLRSMKFLEASARLDYSGFEEPEDVFLCRSSDKILKQQGIKFAPHDLAYKFSVEDMPYKGQFGFHGKHTIQLNKALGIFR